MVVAGAAMAGLAVGVPVAVSATAASAAAGSAAGSAACGPWTGQSLPDGAQLTSVVAFSDCDVWAAGGEGLHSVVVRWDGHSWTVPRGSEVPWVATGQPVTIGGTAHSLWLATFDVRQHLLVKHWNGIRFVPVSVPLPAGATGAAIYGISAASGSDVWAVGNYFDPAAGDLALTEHWDGHAWKAVPAAEPSQQGQPGAGSDYLYGVSARSARDAWAVGTYFDQVTDHQPTLIEHWNGHAWTQVPSPSAAFENQLSAVSADSATDAWAVGYANGLPDQALTEHWNGTAWHVMPSLDPGQDGKNRPSAVLSGVSALSPRDVWAAGWYPLKGGGARTLLAHWNGRSWQQVATPLTRRFWSVLNGLSVPAPGDIWAAGGAMTIAGAWQAIALHRG